MGLPPIKTRIKTHSIVYGDIWRPSRSNERIEVEAVSNSCNANNNPSAQIIGTFPHVAKHNYYLRTDSINVPFKKTDRFKNIITNNYL